MAEDPTPILYRDNDTGELQARDAPASRRPFTTSSRAANTPSCSSTRRTCKARASRATWRRRDIQLGNRADRQLLNHYERIIEQQRDQIDELTRRLEEHEHAKPRPVPPSADESDSDARR